MALRVEVPKKICNGIPYYWHLLCFTLNEQAKELRNLAAKPRCYETPIVGISPINERFALSPLLQFLVSLIISGFYRVLDLTNNSVAPVTL